MYVLLVINGGALHYPESSDHPPRALQLFIMTLRKDDLIQLPLQMALWGRHDLLRRLFLGCLRASEVEDCLLLNVHSNYFAVIPRLILISH
jgi:hypothetical protein